MSKLKDLKKTVEKAAEQVKKVVVEAAEKIKEKAECINYKDEYKQLAAMRKDECTHSNIQKFLTIKSEVKTLNVDEVALQSSLSLKIATAEMPSAADCAYFSAETNHYLTKLVGECNFNECDL